MAGVLDTRIESLCFKVSRTGFFSAESSKLSGLVGREYLTDAKIGVWQGVIDRRIEPLCIKVGDGDFLRAIRQNCRSI